MSVTPIILPMRDQHHNSKPSNWGRVGLGLLTLVIFVLDVATARGHNVAILYAAPVLLSLWTTDLRTTKILAIVCPLLIILGYFFSTPREQPWLAISNRISIFIMVGAAGVIAWQRKSSRLKLQRANDELEDRVQERTTELFEANAKLRKEVDQRELTEDELQRSNRELRQFAYVASHDLNEPLRTIKGYLQLIESRYKDVLNTKGQQDIEVVKAGATRMQQLIEDLLEAAKIRTQGKPFAQVNSTVAAQQAIANLEATVRENEAEITFDALPSVTVDVRQLTQLFENLIGNAIKYRSESPPAIRLTAHEDSDDWVFSVRDNGLGIEPKHAKRIFEMFTRLHGRTEYSGTGIGLAICQRIVERHGGTIWVESELGKGCTFYFTIPKHPPELHANSES
ncbi:MAG: ATP-binding protein [Planctomycetota bacterium]|nr:ATP-binding protein [Planctomycetota bacterium]